MKYVILIFILFSCASDKEGRNNEKDNPALSVSDSYNEAVDRFTQNHIKDGWVISRYKEDRKPEHIGDSLIWSGLALAALSCDAGEVIEDRMIKMMKDNGGYLIRYDPIGDFANGDEISFDGATGLYYGIFNRLQRCKTHSKWRGVWDRHLTALKTSDWVLHPNTSATVPPQFNLIRDYISFLLGFENAPKDSRYRALEAESMIWASAVMVARQPCFRAHLAFLYMSFIEDAGKLLASAHEGFCYATENGNIPIIDHWCGRRDIDKWIEGFEYNVWEYRHQRCLVDGWETPDGRPGLETPALDLIFAIAFVYPEVLD